MLRRLLTLLSMLSLLLCVASAALWVWTETKPQIDFFVVIRPNHSFGLGTEQGALIGFVQRLEPSYGDDTSDDVQLVKGGFRYLRITSSGMRRWNLVLPFWVLMCLFAAFPAGRWFAGRTVRHRRRRGLCLQCGYDLRATPDRCPECGATPAATAPAG
jgi:hypothetical protein